MKRLLGNVYTALSHIKKRIRLAGAVFVFVTLLVATAERATKADDDEREASVIGAGRIGNPFRPTIPSASDFGPVRALVHAGQRNGGFAESSCHALEGPVEPATWRCHGNVVTFGICHGESLR